MAKRLSSQMYRALVKRVGGVDAACAAIGSTTGETVSVGTISKVQNGNMDAPWSHVVALSCATGDRSFLNYFMSLMDEADGADATVAHHIDMLRETTEMIEAVAKAESAPSRDTIVRARKETADVHAQAGRAIAAYDDILRDKVSFVAPRIVEGEA